MMIMESCIDKIAHIKPKMDFDVRIQIRWQVESIKQNEHNANKSQIIQKVNGGYNGLLERIEAFVKIRNDGIFKEFDR